MSAAVVFGGRSVPGAPPSWPTEAATMACAASAGDALRWLLMLMMLTACSPRPDSRAAHVTQPIPAEPHHFVRIAAGSERACGLLASGRVACWGSDGRAAYVVGLRDAVEVHARGRVFWARRANGQLVCWGHSDGGLPIAGGRMVASTPEPVVLDEPFDQLYTFDDGTCYSLDGQLSCRGFHGTERIGVPPVTDVSLGAFHTCALSREGSVYCWGANTDGQVVSPPGWADEAAQPIELPAAAAGIATGWEHSCALLEDGAVRCWGKAWADAWHSREQRVIELPEAVTAIDAQGNASCALTESGRVWCWGAWTVVQADAMPSPPRDVGLDGISQVAVSLSFGCALRSGDVWCWRADFGSAELAWQVTRPPAEPDDDAHADRLDNPVAPRLEPYYRDDQRCREYWGWSGGIREHCVPRPPLPCNLRDTGIECSRQSQCGGDEVCWFARCAAAPPDAPDAVAACFLGVAELAYGGAAPDRVYSFNLRGVPASAAGDTYTASRLNAETASWAERRLFCYANQCGTYETAPGYMHVNGDGFIAGAGETSATEYFLRPADDSIAPPLTEDLTVRWDVLWSFSHDDPDRFASALDLRFWQRAEGCWEQIRYTTQLPADTVEVTVSPELTTSCPAAPP